MCECVLQIKDLNKNYQNHHHKEIKYIIIKRFATTYVLALYLSNFCYGKVKIKS